MDEIVQVEEMRLILFHVTELDPLISIVMLPLILLPRPRSFRFESWVTTPDTSPRYLLHETSNSVSSMPNFAIEMSRAERCVLML